MKKILNFLAIIIISFFSINIVNINTVYAGVWMNKYEGNAGSVCGYYRRGVTRDCKFTAGHNFSIPSGYRLDFASGSIYQGCSASSSGLNSSYSCWGFGTSGGGVNGAANASWRATDPSAPWAIAKSGGGSANVSCSFRSDKYDDSPPNCGTITINGRSGGGFKAGSYTATMYASDGGVGINSCGGGGNFCSGGGRASVTNIDKTPPSCGNVSSTRPNGGGWTREPIPVNVGCWDAKSGCTQGSYTQMIGGGWGNIGIADNATNTNGCDVSYDFWDGTAPSIQIKLDDAHNINSIEYQTSDDQVTVSISAADSQSGVDRTCYELSGATTKAPQCFAGSRIPDFNLTNDGKTIVHAWAFDKAYNYNNGYYYDKDTGGNRADASRDVYF